MAHLARAGEAPLGPGSRLLLRRGSRWDEALELAASGTEDDLGQRPISYDYGRDGAAVEVFGARGSRVHHLEGLGPAPEPLDGDGEAALDRGALERPSAAAPRGCR